MKKLIICGLLSLGFLALCVPAADAFLIRKILHHCCDHKYYTTIYCKQYNAFTPICGGTLYCNGCCPVGPPCCAPSWCAPPPPRAYPYWMNSACGAMPAPTCNSYGPPSCCTSGCCGVGCLPSPGDVAQREPPAAPTSPSSSDTTNNVNQIPRPLPLPPTVSFYRMPVGPAGYYGAYPTRVNPVQQVGHYRGYYPGYYQGYNPQYYGQGYMPNPYYYGYGR